MNILKALNSGYYLLKYNNIDTYKIDTELLLSDSLNISRERLILNYKSPIGKQNYKNFITKLNRRKKKEPVAYIIKKKNFGKTNFMLIKTFLFLGQNLNF